MNELEIGNNVDIEVTNQSGIAEVGVSELTPVVEEDAAIDIIVSKKEYSIVGDNLYMGMTTGDTPEWVNNAIQAAVDLAVASSTKELAEGIDAVNKILLELDIAKNQYKEMFNLEATVERIVLSKMSTMNATMGELSSSIINVDATMVTPEEATAITIRHLNSQIDEGRISSLVTEINTTVANSTQASSKSITSLASVFNDNTARIDETLDSHVTDIEASIQKTTDLIAELYTDEGHPLGTAGVVQTTSADVEVIKGDVKAVAKDITNMEVYGNTDGMVVKLKVVDSKYTNEDPVVFNIPAVDVDDVTVPKPYPVNGDAVESGDWQPTYSGTDTAPVDVPGLTGATSRLENSVKTTNDTVEANFKYESTIMMDGVEYDSGFGLANRVATGETGTSEFWINADTFRFTNGNDTNTQPPFFIDARDPNNPRTVFNGSVTFTNSDSRIAETVTDNEFPNVTENGMPSSVGDTDVMYDYTFTYTHTTIEEMPKCDVISRRMELSDEVALTPMPLPAGIDLDKVWLQYKTWVWMYDNTLDTPCWVINDPSEPGGIPYSGGNTTKNTIGYTVQVSEDSNLSWINDTALVGVFTRPQVPRAVNRWLCTVSGERDITFETMRDACSTIGAGLFTIYININEGMFSNSKSKNDSFRDNGKLVNHIPKNTLYWVYIYTSTVESENLVITTADITDISDVTITSTVKELNGVSTPLIPVSLSTDLVAGEEYTVSGTLSTRIIKAGTEIKDSTGSIVLVADSIPLAQNSYYWLDYNGDTTDASITPHGASVTEYDIGPNGSTKIDGRHIVTGTIQADSINTKGLIAENISSDLISGKTIIGGTIIGATIKGAYITGSFLSLNNAEVLSNYPTNNAGEVWSVYLDGSTYIGYGPDAVSIEPDVVYDSDNSTWLGDGTLDVSLIPDYVSSWLTSIDILHKVFAWSSDNGYVVIDNDYGKSFKLVKYVAKCVFAPNGTETMSQTNASYGTHAETATSAQQTTTVNPFDKLTRSGNIPYKKYPMYTVPSDGGLLGTSQINHLNGYGSCDHYIEIFGMVLNWSWSIDEGNPSKCFQTVSVAYSWDKTVDAVQDLDYVLLHDLPGSYTLSNGVSYTFGITSTDKWCHYAELRITSVDFGANNTDIVIGVNDICKTVRIKSEAWHSKAYAKTTSGSLTLIESHL